MSTPEGQIKAVICRYLSIWQKRGAILFWLNSSTGTFDPTRKIFRKNNSPFALNGVADIIIVLRGGKTIFAEVKTPKGVLSDSQKIFRSKIDAIDGTYVVVRSVEDIKAVLDPLLKIKIMSDSL